MVHLREVVGLKGRYAKHNVAGLTLKVLASVLGVTYQSISIPSTAAIARFPGLRDLKNINATLPAQGLPLYPSPSTGDRGDVEQHSRLRVKDQVLSTASEDVQLVEAVESLELFVRQGSYVGCSLFYRVLKRCIAQKDLALGKSVHALAVRSGHESNAFLANHIIRMYGSHGRLKEAKEVFTKVAAPTTYMWASIITAHAEQGEPEEAISQYRQMRQLFVTPNSYVFVAVLKSCARTGDLACGKQVHADILRCAVEHDIFIGNSLVHMYAKCGSLEDSRNVFDRLPGKDLVTWNSLITGYGQHGLGQEALALYACMQQHGMNPGNNITFVCLLQACASIGDLDKGKQLHAEIQEIGLEADLVVGSCLVNMYAKCGSLMEARSVFDRLPAKDVVTWTGLITAYVQHGFGHEALALFACMQQEGMSPADRVTFICLLQACASVKALHQGMQLHVQVERRGLEDDVIVGNCLVDMYGKCGSPQDARRVFDKLLTKNVVTWTAMLSGYTQQGLGQEALALYKNMQQEGISVANHVTFVCLLQACASVGALNHGKQLHAEIRERGLETDVVVGNSLVDMYAKCGRLKDARRVFDRLPNRDVVTWTAMLNGYAQQGDGLMAIQCFEEMWQQGVEPNNTTFLCLLVACSHSGLVDEGRHFLELMENYNIVPTAHHYNSMVDLLGRSGFLDEAECMLQKMPFQDHVAGWTSLLSACKSRGDAERGRRCFDRLTAFDPENAAPYVLYSNICANAGRWSDVHEIESLRQSAGAKKKLAKATIEVQNKVHEFTVGEERADVTTKLRSMNLSLKDRGYVPHTELVLKAVPDSEKEDALCGHAEKLALAYGLLNTSDGTTLLVTKNLRMCSDCHSSTKIMSRVEKREIIVRDAHRLHHFVDGNCSCAD